MAVERHFLTAIPPKALGEQPSSSFTERRLEDYGVRNLILKSLFCPKAKLTVSACIAGSSLITLPISRARGQEVFFWVLGLRSRTGN